MEKNTAKTGNNYYSIRMAGLKEEDVG